MKVSVILETNQSSQFLDKQLLSISRQKKQPDEVIIINNLPTPDQQLLLDFKQNSPFEVFLIDGNEGKTIIDALKLASGDIVVFSSGDQIWYSSKIKKIHDLLDQEPLLRMVFANGEVINDADQTYIPDYLGITGFYEHWDFFKELAPTLLKKQDFVPLSFLAIDRKFVNLILAFLEDFPTYQPPIPVDQFISVLFGLNYQPESLREIPYVLNQIRVASNEASAHVGESLKPISMNKAFSYSLNQKQERIQSFLEWLSNYRDLVLLADSKNPIIEQIDANIRFQQARIQLLSKSRLKKIAFALQHFVSGDYKRFTSDPKAEFILDII